ncbi:MAG: PAS domain S-box protein [Thermoanaerobaculia bacterium]|nr:PAS domain S-box protein [Thermoanaerobaculia bacterium]
MPPAEEQGASQFVGPTEEVGHLVRTVRYMQAEMRKRSAEIEALNADLQRSHEFSQHLIETAPSAWVMIGSDGRIARVNARLEQMFGYRRDELVGESLELLLAHRCHALYRTLRSEEAEGSRSFVIGEVEDFFGRCKDGSEVAIEMVGAPIGSDGDIDIVVAITDVSARKAAAEREQGRLSAELRLSEERFRVMADTVPNYAFVMLDGEGRVATWNEGAKRQTGYSAEEIVGRSMGLFYRPDDRAAGEHERFLAEAASVRSCERQGWRQRKDGTCFYADVVMAELRDDDSRRLGFAMITRDITQRKHTEQALRDSEERFRSAFQNAPIGMATMATDGRWLQVNPSLCALLGYTEEELLAANLRQLTHADDLEVDVDYTRRMLEGEIRTYEMEKRYLHRSGRTVWARLSVSLVRDDAATPRYFILQIQDISEHKANMEKIHELNADLEERVRQRTAELREANQGLEAFAYSVSHDLRAPLRAVDGFSRILEEDYEEVLDLEGKRLLGVIRNGARTMANLIDDLLEFSRVGRRSFDKTPVDMTTLARSAFDQVLAQLPEERSSIDFRLGELPPAVADPTVLRQVWLNLLGNAVKFSRGREPAIIEVSGTREGRRASYRVEDNGVGFEMEYVDKLFGVFERLHSQDEFEGTGVGLALVKRIVVKHGGDVWASTREDHGAIFGFWLPAPRQEKR